MLQHRGWAYMTRDIHGLLGAEGQFWRHKLMLEALKSLQYVPDVTLLPLYPCMSISV
jgi:hypothetical protein